MLSSLANGGYRPSFHAVKRLKKPPVCPGEPTCSSCSLTSQALPPAPPEQVSNIAAAVAFQRAPSIPTVITSQRLPEMLDVAPDYNAETTKKIAADLNTTPTESDESVPTAHAPNISRNRTGNNMTHEHSRFSGNQPKPVGRVEKTDGQPRRDECPRERELHHPIHQGFTATPVVPTGGKFLLLG